MNKKLEICPRCKFRVLDRDNCGLSSLYQSSHLICVPCWDDEQYEIDKVGINDIKETLESYGPPNNWEEW